MCCLVHDNYLTKVSDAKLAVIIYQNVLRFKVPAGIRIMHELTGAEGTFVCQVTCAEFQRCAGI